MRTPSTTTCEPPTTRATFGVTLRKTSGVSSPLIGFAPRATSSPSDAPSPSVSQRSGLVSPESTNPFLPYDPELYVGDLPPAHVCLLNKFNVVDHHLLIVTREFEHQETALTPADFAAMWSCLQQIDGLAFYNSGTVAGASQPHKHLQLVPLPLLEQGPRIPVESAVAQARFVEGVGRSAKLPFLHALAPIDFPLTTVSTEAGDGPTS